MNDSMGKQGWFIQVLLPSGVQSFPGTDNEDALEDLLRNLRFMYPDFRKIVIYDNETRDAVRLIRNE